MAGGLMVPINDNGYLYSDFLVQHNLPTVLVSRHYLGSINHTLLSVQLLKQLKIPLLGIIFVGEENKSTEDAILKNTKVEVYHRIPIAKNLSKSFIDEEASKLKKVFFQKYLMNNTDNIWHPFTQMKTEINPLMITKTKGVVLYDEHGKRIY